MTDKIEKHNLNKTLASGAFVNILGMIGKGMIPLFFILIARLYGTNVMGNFYILFTLIDIAVTITVSGLNDGVLMFASRFHDDNEKGETNLYQTIANGLLLSTILASLVIIFVYAGGTSFFFEKYKDPEIQNSIKFIIVSVPFVVIPVIIVSATKALIIMKWDAIILGFMKPFLLTLFSLVLYFLESSVRSLVIAFIISNILLSIFSLIIFAKHFSYTKLFHAFTTFRLNRSLILFSIPQNLNMTFNTFITNLDVLMLGYFGFKPELIGFYGIGAQIVRNIRQLKLAFTGIYSPIIARLYKRKDTEGMNNSFSMISRWAIMAAFPAAFIIMIYRKELVSIFHPSYGSYNTDFMILLLIPPLLSCSIGFAGNILVMTGFSLWNLINSLTITFLNAVLNYLMIPEWGLTGAAFATALASLMVSLMQLIELKKLTGTTIVISKIYKAYVAIIPAILISAAVYLLSFEEDIPIKTALALLGLLIYILILYILKIEDEDKKTFMSWKYKKKN